MVVDIFHPPKSVVSSTSFETGLMCAMQYSSVSDAINEKRDMRILNCRRPG